MSEMKYDGKTLGDKLRTRRDAVVEDNKKAAAERFETHCSGFFDRCVEVAGKFADSGYDTVTVGGLDNPATCLADVCNEVARRLHAAGGVDVSVVDENSIRICWEKDTAGVKNE